MNDLDLCLEVFSGHVNHWVTFAIILSETVRDRGMANGESNGHVISDVS